MIEDDLIYNKFQWYNTNIGATVYWVASNNLTVNSGEFLGWFSRDEINSNLDIYVRQGRTQILKFNINQVFASEIACVKYLIAKKQQELDKFEDEVNYLVKDISYLEKNLENLSKKGLTRLDKLE